MKIYFICGGKVMDNKTTLQDYSDIMTIDEVVQYLKLGRSKVYSLLTSGELKGMKFGKIWRIPKESVQQYIDDRMKNTSIKMGDK